MNILITGSNGQLGNEIKKLDNQYPNWKFFYGDLPEIDITNKALIEQFVVDHKVNAMINCAAYTAVDKAEEDKALAYKVNAIGPLVLAEVATAHQLQLIHISTDFVFSGKTHLPYSESDEPSPLSVYGATKLDGEKLVMQQHPDAVIIRTSWLYSAFGNNFVKTMQRLGKEKEQLNVIFDQVGTPTWAADLAAAVLQVLSSDIKDKAGIYHYSNEGVASWYDFSYEIMQLSNLRCKVYPIPTTMYPTPAARPHYSVMDKTKIKNKFGIEIPHWKESLEKCIHEIDSKNLK